MAVGIRWRVLRRREIAKTTRREAVRNLAYQTSDGMRVRTFTETAMRNTLHHLAQSFSVVLTVLFCGAALAEPPAKPAQPHFQGLGHHARRISTQSPEAQKFFDQGLAFLYGFNHDEAIRSFEAAAAIDPENAMSYWGISIANGPHINNPVVDEAHAKAAWKALFDARQRAVHATPVEQALIADQGLTDSTGDLPRRERESWQSVPH